MTHRWINSFSNPTVKYLRSLRNKKYRKREKRFLAEGQRLLTDARDCGLYPELLVISDIHEPDEQFDMLEAATTAFGGELIITSPDILSKITGKDNPQAVAGVFAEFDTSLAQIDRDSAPIWLVAQALRDPGNLGTLLRSGDAVGAGGLILIDDCADPFSVEAVRASMGAIFTQKIARASWEEFLPWLRGGVDAHGADDGGDNADDVGDGGDGGNEASRSQLVAASLRDAVPYRGAPYTTPCFIMVGNESQGLPQAYEAACDLRVTMPMLGRADSLNAAMAGTVLAYEVLAGLKD